MSVWPQGADKPQPCDLAFVTRSPGTVGLTGPLETTLSLSVGSICPSAASPSLHKGFIFLTNEFAIEKEEGSAEMGWWSSGWWLR